MNHLRIAPLTWALFGTLLLAQTGVVEGATIEPGTIPKQAGESETYNLQGQRWRLGRAPVPAMQRPSNPPIYLDKVAAKEQGATTSANGGHPELVIQSGHSLEIMDIARSPDGRWMATAGGYDQTVRIWDLATNAELRQISGHTSTVRAVDISPDGQLIASGADDRSARLWNARTGELVRILKTDPYAALEFTARMMGDVTDLAFSPDGRHIALAVDEDPRILDVETGQEVMPLRGHEHDVKHIEYSPDGSLIATESNDLRLWNARTGKLVRVVVERGVEGRGVAFSPDGRLITTIVRDKDGTRAMVWDVESGKRRFTVEHEEKKRTKRPLGVQFSSDGRWLAVSFPDRIRFVDAATGEQAFEIRREGLRATNLTFLREDNSLIFADGKSAERWDASAKVRLAHYPGRIAPAVSVSIDTDERFLYSIFAPGQNAPESLSTGLLWDLEMGGVRRRGPPVNAKNQARTIGKSHKYVLAGYIKGNLRVWNAEEGQMLHDIDAHQKPIQSVAIDDQGTVIATGSDDYSVVLWRAEDLKRLETLKGHTGLVGDLDFSADGTLLASVSSDHSARVWSVPDGKLLHTLKHDEWIHHVSLSPDGRWLATVQSLITNRQIKLWDLQEKELAYLLVDPENYWGAGLAFSPDSKTIAIGRSDDSITLWDIGTENFRRTEPHTNGVNGITFSADGNLMFTASSDGSLAISRTSSGQVLARLIALTGTSSWVAVTPGGLFDGTPDAWTALAWRFGGDTFDTAPVESFVNEFYFPGLVSEIMRGNYPSAPADISDIDRRQPQLELLRAGASATGPEAERTVSLRIEVQESPAEGAYSSGSGARDVRLFRNGTLVRLWPGDVLDAQGKATLEADVPIVAGENRFQAYAFSNTNIKSADAVLDIEGAASLARQGKLTLLVIGINKYDNSAFDLSYAVTDIDAFVDEVRLQQQALGNFADVEVIRLVDGSATRSDILSALDKLQSLQPEDAAMVYYAGHGTTDGDRFYILPHDLGFAGARDALDQQGFESMLRHGISDRELAAAFQSIDAQEILLFIDACNSGQALEAGEKRRGPMNAKGLAQLAYDKGMNIITAAQGFQLANEHSALGHGFLTYALVQEGLKTDKADTAPRNREITVREWLDFSTARVPEIHAGLLRDATRGLGQKVRATSPEERDQWELQRPRVFYRREAEAEGIVVAETKD